MKLFISLLCFLLLLGCNDPSKERKVVQTDTSVAAFSGAEDVTGAVSALLPLPNSYNLKQAKKWYDQKGENWLVLYETGSFVAQGKEFPSAKLSAVLYLKTDTGFVQQWKMNDFVNDCDLDLVCNYYDNHLSITDLDSNGIAEVMMVYALSCRGDVSPNEKKLILYEGGKKYALRGEELLIMKKDTTGGTYKPDESFKNLPATIRDSAIKHFQKFGVTKYE
ncbi:MAG: hypothetical protein K2X48_11175 [Chitinophagaceae bacterium]|nr:hypothetical protein [Chitinophagaceae bacterium]